MSLHRILFSLLVVVLFLTFTVGGQAKTWEEAIEDVDRMSDDFFRISREKGFDEALGTSFNEVDVQMHLCAILGRMVGHKEVIAHLEPEQPGPDAPGRDFAVAAVSLANWVIAARYHNTLSAEQKYRLWNLDCVGKLDIPGSLAVAVPRGHAVVYDADRRAIMIQGDITPGFASTVETAIRAYPDAQIMSLGSGGGAVYEALEAGMAIRKAGLETELVNGCYSACPLVLAGGTLRFMWWPFKDVGLHQVSSYGQAVPLDSRVYSDIAIYLSAMGVDPYLFIAGMHSAAPQDMFLVDETLRCEMKIITNHQRGCLVID